MWPQGCMGNIRQFVMTIVFQNFPRQGLPPSPSARPGGLPTNAAIVAEPYLQTSICPFDLLALRDAREGLGLEGGSTALFMQDNQLRVPHLDSYPIPALFLPHS
jgi:hypothetical protein